MYVHIERFNRMVQVMNQRHEKSMVLDADLARNLVTDLVNLMNQATAVQTDTIDVSMDGGGFDRK
jgi:hypothetical protein